MMAVSHGIRLATAALGVGILALFGAPAGAQAPPYPLPPPGPYPAAMPPPGPAGEGAQIAACLCDHQQIAALGAEMNAKKHSLDQIRQELADLDAQLERARPTVDVNNPESVERYKALLERHDRAYQRSVGPIVTDTVAAVNRYNERVNAYNRDCGHQLFDAALMAQVNATLACPPR
jgi:hypothetical protein